MYLLFQVINMCLTRFNQSEPPLLNVLCMCKIFLIYTVTKTPLCKEEKCNSCNNVTGQVHWMKDSLLKSPILLINMQ